MGRREYIGRIRFVINKLEKGKGITTSIPMGGLSNRCN